VKNLIYDKSARKFAASSISTARWVKNSNKPADLVVLCAYPFNNVSLMLTGGDRPTL